MSTPLISRKKRNVWGAVSIALAVVVIVLAVLFFNSRAALGEHGTVACRCQSHADYHPIRA